LAYGNYLDDILKLYAKANDEEKLEMRRKLFKNWKISRLGLNFDLGNAEQAVENYLSDPTDFIPFTERRLIRHVQEVCPWAAEISRDLSLHIFTSRRANVVCGLHGERDKGGGKCDLKTTEKSQYRVTGTPFPRRVTPPKTQKGVSRARSAKTKLKEAKTKPEERKGIMDCGCVEDDVILDFYWWKLGFARSVSTGMKEGWKDQRLNPRARAFMVREWKSATALEVNDIFTDNEDELAAEIKRLTKQINNLNSKLEAKKMVMSHQQEEAKKRWQAQQRGA
jgi:hypothetical protein